MNGYKILLLSILTLITAITVQAEAAYVVAHPTLMAPGETGVPLTLTIINNEEYPMLNVTIKPIYTFPFGQYSTINRTNITIPVIPAGSSVNVTLLIDINPRAVDGIYVMRIRLYYSIPNPKLQSISTQSTLPQSIRNATLLNASKALQPYIHLNSTVNTTVPVLGYVRIGANTPFWGSTSSPIQVSPGIGVVPLVIPLINTGNVAASNATAYIRVGDGLAAMSNKTTIGYMPPGVPVYAVFLINVTSKAVGGAVSGSITVKYFANSTQENEVVIPITGRPVLVAQGAVWGSPQSPITVGPGYGVVPLVIPIIDTGNAAVTNVSAKIMLPPGLTPLYSSTPVGSLAPGIPNYAVFMVNVSNVEPGTYYAYLSLDFNGGNASASVPIVVSGSPDVVVQSYYTDPPNLFPGYPAAQLVVYLADVGTSIARNVKVELAGNDHVKVIAPSNGVVNVGNLPVGTPVPINFVISTSDYLYAETKANLTLYVNGTGFSRKYVIPLTVKPKALLEITNVTGSLTAGASDVPLYISITNMGNITARNVEVVLNGQGVLQPYVSSSNPLSALTAGRLEVGDLEPGQSIQVVFMVDAESGVSPGNYKVTLTMLWNQSGSLIPFIQNVPLTVKIQPSLGQSVANLLVPRSIASIMFYVVVILVIALIVVAIRARARRPA